MDKIGHETLKRMKRVGFYNKWLLGKVRKHLRGEILEIGCGIGNMTELMVACGHVTATDIEKYYITKTKRKMKKRANVGFGDVETGKFFFGNKKFDAVVSFNVLEHINDDKKAVANMAKRLKKGGKLVIITPAHKLLFGSLDKNLGHHKRYSKKEISKNFIDVHLKVVETKYLNWFGAIGWFVNARVLQMKVLPLKQLGIFNVVSRPLLFLEKFITPPFGLSVLTVGEKK